MSDATFAKSAFFKAVLLITLLISIVYANSLKNSFVWDDFGAVVDNDFIKSWKNLPMLFNNAYLAAVEDVPYLGAYEPNSGELSYRPVVTLSYFIDYFVWKDRPFGYHLTSLLLHICNALLLYFFVILILQNSSIALLTSLLFALHPVNTEAVAVVSFREDLLAFLFFISSFIFYIKSANYDGRQRVTRYIFSLALFAMALFSKEIALILPFMLILYDRYFVFGKEGKGVPANFKSRYLGFFLVCIFYLVVWGIVLGNKNPPPKYPGDNFYTNILSMAGVIAGYLRWMFMPIGIHATLTYPYLVVNALTPKVLMSILLITILLIFAITIRKRSKEASFSILWFFITLLPVSNIYPLRNIMAARYLYIPIAGLCLFFSLSLLNLAKLKINGVPTKILQNFIGAAIIMVLIFYSASTIMQNHIWKDNIAFWSEMVKFYPDSAIAHYNLGNCLSDNGLLDKAIIEYKTAISHVPTFAYPHANLGICYRDKGMFDEAIIEYKKALRLNPNLPEVYHNLGIALVDKGLYKEAIASFEESIRVDPRFIPAYSGLGAVYARMMKFTEAKMMWEKGLAINPNYKNIQINLKKLKEFGY